MRYGVYSDGEAWTQVELARSTDINWSVDYGVTWTATLPADYDDVTDVRVRYGSVWTDIPVFIDPDSTSPWISLSVHNDIIPLPADRILPIEVTGSALADLYQIGVRMDVYHTDGTILRSGEAWISTDYGRRSNAHPFGLRFIPADDLDEILPVAPFRYIVSQDNLTGAVQLLHGDVLISQLPATVSAAYPLLRRVPDHDALRRDGRRDKRYVVRRGELERRLRSRGYPPHIDAEQVQINSTNLIIPFPPRINVDRAVNGTTRAVHAVGALVRGVVREDALHHVHVWDEDNTLPARTRMSVLGLRRV